MLTLTFEQFFIVLSVLLSGVAALAGIVQAFYPMWVEHRNRKYLQRISRYELFDKSTIDSATRGYIRPKCQNLDPAQEQELRYALVATREDLFQKVDYFLDHENTKRHLFVLAESGIGKTSFVLNYYVYNKNRGIRRHPVFPIPLGHNRSDEVINQIKNDKNPSEIVLFLDAFDEDIRAIENYRSRIQEIVRITSDFKKVIITCRTQFFPKEEEIPSDTGIMRFGSRKAGDKGFYEFRKIYLSPFDDNDIDMYVKKHYAFWKYGLKTFKLRDQAIAIAKHIPMLSVRPMLLAHIPDLVNRGFGLKQSDPLSLAQLYEIMVNAWIDRETYWVDKSNLREFSERLAVEMVVNRSDRGMERIPYDELDKLAENWNIKMKQWQLSGRSLLNRDPDGNYKFAHRSIMEYLFVERYINGDNNCSKIPLNDQMLKFFFTKKGYQPNLRKIEDVVTNFFSNSTISMDGIQNSVDNSISDIIRSSISVFGNRCRGVIILYPNFENPTQRKVIGMSLNSLLISDINNSVGLVLDQHRNQIIPLGHFEGTIHKALISFNIRKTLTEKAPLIYQDVNIQKNMMISIPIRMSEKSEPMGVLIVEMDQPEDQAQLFALMSEISYRAASMLMFTARYVTDHVLAATR